MAYSYQRVCTEQILFLGSKSGIPYWEKDVSCSYKAKNWGSSGIWSWVSFRGSTYQTPTRYLKEYGWVWYGCRIRWGRHKWGDLIFGSVYIRSRNTIYLEGRHPFQGYVRQASRELEILQYFQMMWRSTHFKKMSIWDGSLRGGWPCILCG